MLPHAAVVLALAASGPAPIVASPFGADAALQAGALRPRLERVELVGLASSIAPAPPRQDAPPSASSDGSVRLGERRFVLEALDAAPEGSPPAPPPRLVARDLAEKELWSLELGRAPAPDEPGAYLWAPRRPNATESAPIALQQDGDTLLACAPNGDLLRVSADGKVLAKLERVWEFERGFIGPSVWTHHLARFGVEDFDAQERTPPANLAEHAEYARALDRARAEETAGVTGGPIVAGERVFVAVASAKKGSWSAYLGRGRVYELDHDLRPLGLVELPRVPLGSLATADADGVTWGAERRPLRASRRRRSKSCGAWARAAGTACCTCRGRRSCAPSSAKRGSRPTRRGAACCSRTGSRSRHPTAASSRGRTSTSRFALVRVRLADGAERALELRVPYEGELARPTTNYSGDGKSVRAMGPYGLGLTGLERVGPRLIVHLATTASTWTVEFELAKVLGD